MSSHPQIIWRFLKGEPPCDLIVAWHKLCQESKLISASSTPSFALNANKLIQADVFYAFGYINEQLVTALPLVIKSSKRFGLHFRYLQVATHDHLDYFVAAGQSELSESELLESLIGATRNQLSGWNLFFSRRWFFVSEVEPRWTSLSYSRQAAYFDLTEKLDINDVISKKLFKNLTRFEKKLIASNESLELEQIQQPSRIQAALDIFYQIEAAGWKGNAGSAISQTKSLQLFYDQCWDDFANNGNAVVFLLKQATHSIAACIAFKHNKTLFLHKIAYDEGLAKLSPGSVLVKRIIENGIKQSSIHKICFNTNPPWVQRWHPQLDQLKSIQAFNYNIKGYTIRVAVRIYYALRNIKRRIKKT